MLKSIYSKLALSSITKSIKNFIGLGEKCVFSEEELDEVESMLISADLGINLSTKIIDRMRKGVLKDISLNEFLKKIFLDILDKVDYQTPLSEFLFYNEIIEEKPYSILMCGVNGGGKTTTISKIAKIINQKKATMFVSAADTFRAGADKQLQINLSRVGISESNILGKSGDDPSSVCYAGLDKAIQNRCDFFLVDTAGRIPNSKPLMAQLEKIARVMSKLLSNAPHEIILIIDATTGQHAVHQVEMFGQVLKITGIILTKMDGRCRGGTILSIIEKYRIPILAVCYGEDFDSIAPFDKNLFIDKIIGV